MRLKLNHDSANGLYNLLTALMLDYKPENIAEKLIDDHMKDIYERLRKKVIAGWVKDYSITLNEKEAKAYYIFFNQNKISISWPFEANLVQSHIHLIDKIYA